MTTTAGPTAGPTEAGPSTTTQVYELYIRATPGVLWDAITNPQVVATFFHGAQVEST